MGEHITSYAIEDNIGLVKWKSKQWADRQPLLTYDEIFSYASESYIKAERKADKTLPSKAVIAYIVKSMDRAISSAIKREGKANKSSYIKPAYTDSVEEFTTDEDIHIRDSIQKIFAILDEEESEIIERYFLKGETLASLSKEKNVNQMAMTRKVQAIKEKIIENVRLE